jgi:hypothetical protein
MPLPTLTDAREQSLLDSGANLDARRAIQHILEETYRQYLRRGMNVQLEVSFVVADGTIQEQIWVGARRKHGGGPGWRQEREER